MQESMQMSGLFISCVYATYRSEWPRYFRALFFDMSDTVRDHWAEKIDRVPRDTLYSKIGDKRKNGWISTACIFDKRKTRTRIWHEGNIHIHIHAYTRRTNTCLYTAYKMNARWHTLNGERTKLATGGFDL